MSFVSGFVTPVPVENKDAYVASAKAAWVLFREYGALHHMEAWGVDLPKGQVNDFMTAVQLKDGETTVFSWVTWPDQATADACFASMQTDDRWQALDMPFDGARMIFGGFASVFEARS